MFVVGSQTRPDPLLLWELENGGFVPLGQSPLRNLAATSAFG
jgi:hypothetical protein